MSDFLSRLVDRSVAVSPAPMPVVPPLFAPGNMAAPSVALGVDDAINATAEARATPPQPWVISQPPSVEGFTPAPRPPVGAPPTDALVAIPPPPARGLARGPEPPQVRTHRASMRDPTREPPFTPPAPAVRSAPVHVTPGSARREAPVAPFAPIVPATPSLQSDIRQSSDSRPVIRVSIGRIEVRAVTTPPAAPPASAPPKRTAIQLEDYLRTRGRD